MVSHMIVGREVGNTSRICKNEACAAEFIPLRKTKVFCCRKCKDTVLGRIHNAARNERAWAKKQEKRGEIEKAKAQRIATKNITIEARRLAYSERRNRICHNVECGIAFDGHPNALYCCIACSYKAAYLRIREVHLAREKAKTLERALKRPVVICAHPGCSVEFRQKRSNNVFCDAHGKRAQHSGAAKRGAPKRLTVDPEVVKATLAAQGLLVAVQESTTNSVKHCMDRRGLECRKFFGKKCFDVRNLKQCGKTL